MEHSDNLGYLLNKAARMTKWDLTNALQAEGITAAQFGLIKDVYVTERLFKDEEEMLQHLTPAAIAERLHADRPTISCMIERLVKQDWVYRASNPKDRRSQIILLTDKAMALMPKLEILGKQTMSKATKDFDEAELNQLKKFLHRIIENLNA